MQFTTNCCNFSRSERQCAGAKLKKTDEIAMKTVVGVTVECKVAKQKMPKGCLVAAKTRITNHFSSSISMMYRCRWSTNMVTMYCRGWPTFRNAAYQKHFRHQPTVKRKVERGVPNATNSLTPEDPGSILAIVSMRIRTGWLGHANQVHIPTIAKVSDPSAVNTCKGTMIFPPHHLLFRKEATPFEQTRTRSNMEQKHISSNPKG